MVDRDRKGRTANGIKISNTVKLTDDVVREMRALWDREGQTLKPGQRGGLNYSELGRRFGVSNVMARRVVLRHYWKHVKPCIWN